ncbi:MAG: hypothetical protein LLG20_14760 [Acidobacteriales bacterium]|nr:hypothetical protein [Terriglobales bacterium]
MKPLNVIAVVCLTCVSVRADFFYKLVGYKCNGKAIVITYAGAPNEAGKKMMKSKNPRQWDPWKLITLTKDKNSIDSLKTVGGQCALEDGTYDVTFGALPGNANLQGMCGGFMSAWVEVKRGADAILPRHRFESPDCHSSRANSVTVRIVIEPGGKKPAIETVPGEDFYRPR